MSRNPAARFLVLALLLLAVFVTGCASNTRFAMSNAPPRDKYKVVDYKQWFSGLYADEYIGKWVVAEGYYIPDRYLETYSYENVAPISVLLTDQPKALRSTSDAGGFHFISATVRANMRYQIADLKPEQIIRVYGKAYQDAVRRGISNSLFIEVQAIEAR